MRLFASLFLLIAVVICTITANEKYTKTKRRLYGLCPPGFTQINVECYYISEPKANWLDAHFECKDKNSRLAEPTKFADKHLRKYLVTKDKDRTQLWIGGTYDWKSNKWQWGHSGKEVKYHAFSAAEQRSSKELEYHCAVMDPDKKYRWSAKSCADRYRFICQHRMPKVSRKNREKVYNRWNTTYPNQMANEFILEITDIRVNGTRTHRKIRPVTTNELELPTKETQRAKNKNVDTPVILNDMQISFTNLVPEDPNEFSNGSPPEQRRLPRTHLEDTGKPKQGHDNTVQTEFDRRVEIQRRQEFERKQRRRLQRRKKLQREREERERAELERQRQIQAQKMREEQISQQETDFENQRVRVAEQEKLLESQRPYPVTTSQPIQDNKYTNEALPSPDENAFADRMRKDELEQTNDEMQYEKGKPLQHKEEKVQTPEIHPPVISAETVENPPRTEPRSDFRDNTVDDNDRVRKEHKLQLQEEAQRAEEERRYLDEIAGYTTDAYEAEKARVERDRQRFAEIERKREEERRLREEILRKENEEREQLEREMREKELAYQKALEEEEQRRKEEEDRRQREEMQKVQARAEKRRKAEQRRRQLLREREEAASKKAKEMQKEAEKLRQQRIRDRIQNLSPEKRELFFKEREKQRQKRRLERENRNEVAVSEQD